MPTESVGYTVPGDACAAVAVAVAVVVFAQLAPCEATSGFPAGDDYRVWSRFEFVECLSGPDGDDSQAAIVRGWHVLSPKPGLGLGQRCTTCHRVMV